MLRCPNCNSSDVLLRTTVVFDQQIAQVAGDGTVTINPRTTTTPHLSFAWACDTCGEVTEASIRTS